MRLKNPETGVTVQVDEAYGKELQALGWKPAEAPKKAPAKSEK